MLTYRNSTSCPQSGYRSNLNHFSEVLNNYLRTAFATKKKKKKDPYIVTQDPLPVSRTSSSKTWLQENWLTQGHSISCLVKMGTFPLLCCKHGLIDGILMFSCLASIFSSLSPFLEEIYGPEGSWFSLIRDQKDIPVSFQHLFIQLVCLARSMVPLMSFSFLTNIL